MCFFSSDSRKLPSSLVLLRTPTPSGAYGLWFGVGERKRGFPSEMAWVVDTGSAQHLELGMVVGGSPVLAAGANDEIGEEAVAGGGGSVGESDGREPLKMGKRT